MPRAPPRLLVIDDDAGVRGVVAGVARSAGFAVTGCDGNGTLDACLEGCADLVILDLVMPIVDGIEVIERLAAAHAASRLVLVSGQDRRVLASASRLAVARGLKVAAVFAKPFSQAQLRDCLTEQRNALALDDEVRPNQAAVETSAARIAEALQAGEIVLHYQPQVSLDRLEWTGVEALVRWRHPVHGLLGAAVFVPVAEHDPALMSALTDHVVQSAFRDLAPLAAECGFQGRIALNVPSDKLSDAEFPHQLVEHADRAGIRRDRLVLEVTETTLPADPVRSLAIQTRLRMLGVSLAVDDYGTGHSSLERLHTFPMDELKIDLQFVRESTTDPEARAIVHNSIELARELDVRCVAEGVEDVEALTLLRRMRCGFAQGYFVARPMPASELARWSAQWNERRAVLRSPN